LETAGLIALNSDCKNFKLGSIIINRKTNEIVSKGYNHYSKYMKNAITCHAEIDAMYKIKKLPKEMKQHLDLYVVRINRQQLVRYAKPCCDCMRAIQSFGIKRVYYSTDTNIRRTDDTAIKATYTKKSTSRW
jgi:deoxycytidylate deaminase